MAQWLSTKYKGVRYRLHSTRKHGLKRDKYFAIRYQANGRRVEEGLGWSSEGWTEEKAALKLAELKAAAKIGEGPARLSEKRQIEDKRKETERAAREQADKENITFGDYFTKTYFPTFEVGRKKETTRKAKEHFKNWIEPVIGRTLLKDVSPFSIEKIKKNVLAANKAPRSLQYVFATIRQAWNMARRDGLVTGESPTKLVKVPKVDNKRVRFLNHTEAEALLNALRDKDRTAHDMALLSLHTGLRVGEMVQLKWSHIDIERAIVRVLDTKSAKGRAAFMTAQVKAMFEAMKRRGPEDFVFIKNEGDGLKEMPRVFFEVVQDLGFNNGIIDRREKAVAHTLRHTFASWHVMAGTDIYILKELMGHSVIQMTERYSHLSPVTLQNATQNLERAIDGTAQNGKLINLQK
ncbi:MAG: site-specific integrase [Smithella sp.]